MNKRRMIQTIVLSLVAAVFFFLVSGIQGVKGVKVGDLAYDFTLEDLDGGTHTLSDYRGQFVVLNFFATWCKPCVDEEPELEAFHQQYGDKYKLLIIDRGEPKSRVEKFIKEHNSTTLYLFDTDDKVSKNYLVVGQPETFIIDPSGIIRERIVGPTTAETLAGKISLLKLNGK
ncbi:TlpA disulfide reductase family protein [Cytobacillus sp. IB215665]|uniref:TlpA family protein disulfide reductase n=1 Tax=Cytobacillus sp. IB215665 TaxID=3097357 RepID=UPI002A0E2E54|nr:TlpA disulfide reductase family protein [Cytobacillus sp. IB215665]MDX8364140.1 TlpA disulfide reductase family protein [Cytobacillus sp. IB215665]